MRKLSVLVTGVGGGGVGEQILKCLHLSDLELNIVGCDMNSTSKGLREVDKAYIVPRSTDNRYIDSLLNICRWNDVKIIFPGSEPELKVLSDQRRVFSSKSICIPLNTSKVINMCMDKNLTMSFLRKNSFFTPRYWEICKREDLSEVDVFPVVLKPSIGGGGSINTFIAQDRAELDMFGEYLLGLYSVFTVQEYIGDVDHEYTVGVMLASDGMYINSIAVKKNILSGLSNKMRIPNRTGRIELGATLGISSGISQGEIGRFKEATEPCKVIAEALNATAPINIQGRVYMDRFYVFEINPRISGTSPLRAMVGYNEPDMLIRERILGEKLETDFSYKEGIITRGLQETFISSEFMSNIEVVQ